MSHTLKTRVQPSFIRLAVIVMFIVGTATVLFSADERDLRRETTTLIRAGKHAEAAALCQQIVRDDTAETALRVDLAIKAAGILRHPLKQVEAAEKTLDSLKKLELTPTQEVTIQHQKWILAIHGYRPRDPKMVEQRGVTLVNNTDASLKLRASVLKGLLDIFHAMRNAEDKARPLTIAETFLAENELPIKDEVQLREKLLRTYNAIQNGEAAITHAQAIFDAEEASAQARVAACAHLADPLIEADRLPEARTRLREAFSIQDLNPSLIAKNLQQIGRTHLLKDELDEALAVYQEGYRYFLTSEMTNQVTRLKADALAEFLRFEEAAQLWLKLDQPLLAADIYDLPKSPFADQAHAIRLAVLEDVTRPAAERRRAYPSFLTQKRADVPIAERYYEIFITDNTNRAASLLRRKISWPHNITVGSTAYYGDFEATIRYFHWLKPLVPNNPDFVTTVCALNAYTALGRFDEARNLAREAASYESFKPHEVYQMKMTQAGLGMHAAEQEQQTLQALFEKTDAKAAKTEELTPTERAQAAELTGATLLHGKEQLEKAVRALDAFRLALYAAEPRKHYTVKYSQKPISGLEVWQAVAPETEKQFMDRKYGGSLEFLVTDVSTGDRGAGIGQEADSRPARFPEIAFICDVNGIHFRCETFDSRAREVEAKLLGGGSYEGYIAAGENQPYICFLIDIQSGKFSFYNTTYENKNHRRVKTEDISRWRGEHQFSDTGYSTYLFFAWETFVDKIPEQGTVWDFENVIWGREGKHSWNGLKSIHGRSSWGALVFDLPREAQIAIKRKLIFTALANYQREKITRSSHEGVLDFWQDPVVGDPKFYTRHLKTFVEHLDTFVPLVKADMSDHDVEKVFLEAVPSWNNIHHIAADLRRQFLSEMFTE